GSRGCGAPARSTRFRRARERARRRVAGKLGRSGRTYLADGSCRDILRRSRRGLKTMTTRDARGVAAMETEEESIAVYLQHNPDFFERHQAVLTRLRLPHARGGSTISLVERQIEVLREKHAALEGKLAELVQVARGNDVIAEKLHRFTRRLLGAPSRAEAIARIESTLREDFDA